MNLHRLLCFALFLFAIVIVRGTAAQAPAPTDITGPWQGAIKVSGIELRVIVQFTSKGDGQYSGTFISVDQGNQALPLDSVTFTNGTLHFELKIGQASWEGKLNTAGDELAGKWTQKGDSVELNFKRGGKIEAPKRPQEPKKPYPYREEEVLYDNKSAGTKIGGTLTLPEAKGPFPAVLLITGSGQQNRNEELLGHKPFLIIADYLTRRGIAVLRVDDRGMGTSTGDFAKATTADFATDVEAGVAFLRTRRDIRHNKIGLIGHSEGGVIAPMVAARDKDVGFIVMLAGTGVDGGKILIAQGELISRAQGVPEDAIKFDADLKKHMFSVLASEKDPGKVEQEVRAAVAADIQKLPAADRARVEKAGDASVRTVTSPWMRYFITYDPAIALRKVKCPVLVLNGSKDLQVPPKLNLPAIEAALKAGGNKDYTLKLLPGLNHLFQTCETGSPTEYARIEETMSPLALETMGDWITAHCK